MADATVGNLGMDTPAPAPMDPLPSIEDLQSLERRARRSGSGLGPDDLPGTWWLTGVWGKAGQPPLPLAAASLRGLGARLEIGPPADGGGPLPIANAVNLGPLMLRFSGEARLRGRRPLLSFWFDRMQLLWGERPLLSRPLARPEPRRLPFFALIGRGLTGPVDPGADAGAGAWLAARGRGGGLALWRRG